jgi:hypothetical protein
MAVAILIDQVVAVAAVMKSDKWQLLAAVEATDSSG